jgi:tripartite-type tricarboxylate transporter receptor subunit TctC
LIAPAATPAPILQKLHRTVYEVTADAKSRKAFEALGVEIVDLSYDKTSEMLPNETATWSKFVKDANIRQE